MLAALPSRFAWAGLGAWLLTLADLVPRLGDSRFETCLAVLSVVGLAGAIAWLRGWARWASLSTAAAYLAFYAVRMFTLEVEPLLAIMSMPDAIGDTFYVLWSSPVGRLSHGEVLDAAREVWRGWLTPLVQAGVLSAAASSRFS